MSIELMSKVLATTIPTGPKFVLAVLADHADDYGSNCFPSVALICDKTSLTENPVRNHIQWLEKRRFISRIHARGQATHYLLIVNEIEKVMVDLKAKHQSAYSFASQVRVKISDFPVNPPVDKSEKPFKTSPKPRVSTLPESEVPLNQSPLNQGLPESEGVTANPYKADLTLNQGLPESEVPLNPSPLNQGATTPCFRGYNHHITIKSSTTNDGKVIHNLESQASKSENGDDVEKVVELISTWEQGRSKTLKVSANDRAKISCWLQVRVSEDVLRFAYDTAVAQREKRGDPSSVTIGYLDSIIASALKAGQSAGAPSALNNQVSPGLNGTPWYVTDSGIEKMAQSMRVNKLSTESWPEFKNRVLTYAQVDPGQYRQDLSKFRDLTAQSGGLT